MTRNQKGIIGWFIISCIINLLAWPVMAGREYYQYKHYHLPSFEWDDIQRYTITIIAGSLINFVIIAIIFVSLQHQLYH